MTKYKILLINLLITCVLCFSCSKKDPIQYELTTSVLPVEGGTISPASGLYKEGESVILTATPASEYLFTGWSDGAVGSTNPVTVVMNSKKVVTASFERRKYPLSIVIEGEGTVKEEIVSNKSITEYTSGTNVRLTAVASNGSEFVAWNGDVSGNVNPITITIDKSKSIKATFKKLPTKFVSRAPVYNYPNNTVGQIRNGYFFPGYYVTDDTAAVKYCIRNPVPPGSKPWYGVTYRFNDNNSVYLDFNNDGILDMFAFLTNFVDQPWGSASGKYMLVKNVLSVNPEIKYFDCTSRFGANFQVSDFNNDGINEIIQGSEDGHELQGGIYGSESPVKIISFAQDGTINLRELGIPMGVCGLATGDINRDGNVDVLVWRNNTNGGQGQPFLYLNDGLGNFTLVDSYSFFAGLKEIIQENGQYICSIGLFDLNKDGYLDLITGQNIGQIKLQPWEDYRIPNCRIYWGNSQGSFDFKNNYSDLPNTSIKDFSVANSVLGFSILDFDKDGDFDVLVSVTPNYGGYYLQLYENLSNKSFTDVTESKIQGYSNIFPRGAGKDGDFTNFYNIGLYDIDNDGDFDIMPRNIAPWTMWSYSPNLYWENVGGSFLRRNF